MADRFPDEAEKACWLCARPLGRRVERHHPLPRSRGGRETVAVHPVCHRAIHAALTNAQLAALPPGAEALRSHPDLARFIGWIADKPPDFHVVTAPRRRDRR